MMPDNEELEIVRWDTDRIYLKKSSGSDLIHQETNDTGKGNFIVFKEKWKNFPLITWKGYPVLVQRWVNRTKMTALSNTTENYWLSIQRSCVRRLGHTVIPVKIIRYLPSLILRFSMRKPDISVRISRPGPILIRKGFLLGTVQHSYWQVSGWSKPRFFIPSGNHKLNDFRRRWWS